MLAGEEAEQSKKEVTITVVTIWPLGFHGWQYWQRGLQGSPQKDGIHWINKTCREKVMRLYILVCTQDHPTQLTTSFMAAGWRRGCLCRGQVLSRTSFLFRSGFSLENRSPVNRGRILWIHRNTLLRCVASEKNGGIRGDSKYINKHIKPRFVKGSRPLLRCRKTAASYVTQTQIIKRGWTNTQTALAARPSVNESSGFWFFLSKRCFIHITVSSAVMLKAQCKMGLVSETTPKTLNFNRTVWQRVRRKRVLVFHRIIDP